MVSHKELSRMREEDDINSYLAGDLAVGVRRNHSATEGRPQSPDGSIASSSTTSSGRMMSAEPYHQMSFSAVGTEGASHNTTSAAGDGTLESSSAVPMSSIRQPESGLSLLTTHSSLSSATGEATRLSSHQIRLEDDTGTGTDGGGSLARTAAAAYAPDVNNNNIDDSAIGGQSSDVPSSLTAHDNVDAQDVSAAQSLSNEAAPQTPGRRSGSGTKNNIENTPPMEGTLNDAGAGSRLHRSTSGGAASATDSWGFFDDHDHLGDTPGNSTSDLKRKGSVDKTGSGRGASSSSAGGTSSGSGPKRKGMLQFSDVISAQPTIPLLSPERPAPSAGAVSAPNYVLEESRSSQNLWKHTAGNRPPQPAEERAFYEQIWAENFSKSQVNYEMPPEVLTATTPISLSAFADGRDDAPGATEHLGGDYAVGADSSRGRTTIGGIGGASSIGPSRMLGTGGAAGHYHLAKTGDSGLGPHHPHHTIVNQTIHEKDGDLLVVCKGDNVFGTTVSKSFETVVGSGSKARTESVSVSVSVASYRVVESKTEKGKQYAQFLVIYCEGSFRDTVGVWRRYSDFKELSRRLMHGHGEGCATALQGMNPMSVTEEAETELLPNAITSWRLLKKRQRWFRCLDAGYLSLKVFLLERFLHDILFESSTPDIIREFVGVR